MKLIDISPNSLFGRLLRLPLRLLPGRTVVPILTGINKGYRWRVGSNIHGCWLGSYESDKQQLMNLLVKPGMIAYDIGANAGFYTLALTRLVGSGGKVCAFEPLAENAANILDHLRHLIIAVKQPSTKWQYRIRTVFLRSMWRKVIPWDI